MQRCWFHVFDSLTSSSLSVTAVCIQKQVDRNKCEYRKATFHCPSQRSTAFTSLFTSITQWDVRYKHAQISRNFFFRLNLTWLCNVVPASWMIFLKMAATTRILGLQVRIPPKAWKSVSCKCCLLPGKNLCNGPNCVCVCVCLCVSLNVIRCNKSTLNLQWLCRKRSEQESEKERYQDWPHTDRGNPSIIPNRTASIPTKFRNRYLPCTSVKHYTIHQLIWKF